MDPTWYGVQSLVGMGTKLDAKAICSKYDYTYGIGDAID